MADLCKILVVEDDDDLRECIAEALRIEGYEVVESPHGAHAIERLRSGLRPAFILLDMKMPVMNGWDVTAELRADPELRDIPVVAMTAVVPGIHTGEPLPGDRILPKPVRFIDLDRIAQRYCGLPPPLRDPSESAEGEEAGA